MYKQITVQELEEKMKQGNLIIVDVRDIANYDQDHIVGAIHLSVDALSEFCQTTSCDTPVLVYCYHGVSSQSVAQHLVDQGFTQVFSLVGGFETWKLKNRSM